MKKKDIFYRPDLKPKRDYMSDAEIPKEEEQLPDIEEEEVSEVDELEELKETLEDIIGVLDIVPREIMEALEPSLIRIRQSMEAIELPTPEPQPSEQTPAEPEEEDGEDIPPTPATDDRDPTPGYPKKVPDLFPEDPPITVEYVWPKPIPVVLEEVYNIDLKDIYEDFVYNLQRVLMKYIPDLLYTANVGGLPDYRDLFYEYKLSAAKIDDDFKHVSDTVTRMQVYRNQKAKLFKKIYNIDQTIYHLRAIKTAYELRSRYYKANYQKPKDYLDTHSNDLLRDSRTSYDKKYQQNMYNFYKYLNSAVILVEETLDAFMKEAKGKAILHKQGYDILEGLTEEDKSKKRHTSRQEQQRQEQRAKTRLEDLPLTATRTSGSNTYNAGGMPGLPTGTGGNQDVVTIAIRWAQTRGLGSANPVKYSMTKRAGDPDLKQWGDCSSFVRKVFREAGKGDIGGYTGAQITNPRGQFIESLSQLQPGDCMFFGPTGKHVHYNTMPDGRRIATAHVGIYIGDNKFVDLSSGVTTISIKDFSPGARYHDYVTKRFVGGKRF